MHTCIRHNIQPYNISNIGHHITHVLRLWTPEIDPSHKSLDVSDKYPTMHHFVTEICIHVYISVTRWCIVGYGLVHCGIFEIGLLMDPWACSWEFYDNELMIFDLSFENNSNDILEKGIGDDRLAHTEVPYIVQFTWICQWMRLTDIIVLAVPSFWSHLFESIGLCDPSRRHLNIYI